MAFWGGTWGLIFESKEAFLGITCPSLERRVVFWGEDVLCWGGKWYLVGANVVF